MSISPGNDQPASVGDTWLSGWDIGGTNDEVFVFNGPFQGLTADAGEQWVVFDSQNAPPPGVVFQTFSTAVGQSYVVTFAAAAVYDDGAPFKSLSATATASDGSLLATTNVVPAPTWSTNQLNFTATTINTTLAFTDVSTPALGPSVALDAVTVQSATNAVSAQTFNLTALGLEPGASAIVLQLSAPSGQSYILAVSTNLMNWTPVSTNTLSNTPVNITNPLIPGAVQEF